MIRGTLISAMMVILTAATASAQNGDSDKLDIKKLEDKYWSAKDDDFSVVQNRAYSKAGRFFVNLQGGIPINDPYSSGTLSGVSGGYHFSERWGLEGTYLSASFRDNDATERFRTDHQTVPNHNSLKSQMGLQVNYIPFYAKMSFLDKKIIYFDMGVGIGAGQTTFEQNVSTGNRTESAPYYALSVYQQFFFSEHWALKVDYRNTWTSEEQMRYRINSGAPLFETESSRSIGKKSINDTALLIGLTFFFGGGGQ